MNTKNRNEYQKLYMRRYFLRYPDKLRASRRKAQAKFQKTSKYIIIRDRYLNSPKGIKAKKRANARYYAKNLS